MIPWLGVQAVAPINERIAANVAFMHFVMVASSLHARSFRTFAAA
jgi:hypothetical protein